MKKDLLITPDTKIGALLDVYPGLEKVLIEIAPAFEKLRNPVLRKTVAKFATLHQAAELGKIPTGNLINRLREVAGQDFGEVATDEAGHSNISKPEWVTSGIIHDTIDARPIISAGEHPLNMVMSALKNLPKNTVLVLISPFTPAPLITVARQKEFKVWSEQESPDLFKTYFSHKDI